MRIRCICRLMERRDLRELCILLLFQVFSFTMKCWRALTGGGGLDETLLLIGELWYSLNVMSSLNLWKQPLTWAGRRLWIQHINSTSCYTLHTHNATLMWCIFILKCSEMVDRNWLDQFLALISPSKAPAQAKVWTHNAQWVSPGDTPSMNLIIDWKVRNCIKEDILNPDIISSLTPAIVGVIADFVCLPQVPGEWVHQLSMLSLQLCHNHSLILCLSLCNKTWRSVRGASRRNL